MFFPLSSFVLFFFFFNDTATTEIYTLSLHDALPISSRTSNPARSRERPPGPRAERRRLWVISLRDRKSTRLNSSHPSISYAVFCLKKKKTLDSNQPVRAPDSHHHVSPHVASVLLIRS